MAGTSTTNYQLYKPDPSDNVNVATDINANYDKIDAGLNDLHNPPWGKLWSTGGFQALAASPGVQVLFDKSKVRNGMAVGANSDGLIVPRDGIYEVKIFGYASGSTGAWTARFDVYRVRSGVGNRTLIISPFSKPDGLDYAACMVDDVPLKAGDELRVNGTSTPAGGSTWGSDEFNGTRLTVRYKSPLAPDAAA